MTDLGIVMPVYKQLPLYLYSSIQSILTQTFRDYRFIIVVDGAPEMLPFIQKMVQDDARAEVLINSTNLGVARSLNRGFDHLFKDQNIHYVTWVSSDNVYYPNFLEVLRNTLVSGGEELGLVFSSFRSINNEGLPLQGEAELAALRQYQSQPKEALLDACIVGVSFMYKSKFAKMIDGYGLQPVEDYDYWLRLAEHCEMRYIPIELMDYRVNSPHSVSSQLQSTVKHREWRYAYHLARLLARNRRGIPFEITILLPLREIDQAILERLENLYEQSFSNYSVTVLDLSPDGEVTKQIQQIIHPTVAFLRLPHLSVKEAIRQEVVNVKTPYVFILGPELFRDPTELEVLHYQLKIAQPYIQCCYYTANHTLVGFSGQYAPDEPLDNRLYRTNSLISILKSENL
ncbi:glycosyltransferase family 2 protein [Bacillus sp. BRMEA1]|uniref:glycosyltransferase family 2 protein n=1 Tax=Neobacillus endophyticus TaxID=2738405 RepID=UPI001565652D|nr:glycosyltransferase family 2 protein [Neobacillus endophyticus]NRD78504.1 glycosyltransferase family 2 protein [Neobacillus endophyticus]